MAASATAEAREALAREASAPADKERPVQQTSIATRGTPPGEVMVRFRKWHAHAQTAYQKGCFAGFQFAIAERLEAAGVVQIDPGYAREAVNRMIRK